MTACIVGWAHPAFGKHEGMDKEALIGAVVPDALRDAGIAASDVDEVFVGLFNSGLSAQDFPASLPMHVEPALRLKLTTRVENACATGSVAIHQGLRSIGAGARIVLVVGAEKMTGLPAARIAEALLHAICVKEDGRTSGGFAGVFGRIAEAYFARFGDQREVSRGSRSRTTQPARAIPARTFAGRSTSSSVGLRRSRIQSSPDRSSAPTCSPISAGAAALILADAETARSMRKAVQFRAAAHVNEFLPMSRRDPTELVGAAEAWRRALPRPCRPRRSRPRRDARLLHHRRADGVRGHGALPGWRGRPRDPGGMGRGGRAASGGPKAKGHPIGATGVSMHVLAAQQLTATAGEIQVPGAELAGGLQHGWRWRRELLRILERAR